MSIEVLCAGIAVADFGIERRGLPAPPIETIDGAGRKAPVVGPGGNTDRVFSGRSTRRMSRRLRP